MTIMNGQIRRELTQLLADHLVDEHIKKILQGRTYPVSAGLFREIAAEAMDFIYGSEDDNVQKPELPQEAPDLLGLREGDPVRDPGCCGGTGCGDAGDLRGVEHSSLLGVIAPREAFVYLDHRSPTERPVPLRECGSEQTAPSAPEPGSADE